MIPCRIKTEEEFLAEFDSDWRKQLGVGWNSAMNSLFGKFLEHDLKNNIVALNWSISPKMVIPLEGETYDRYKEYLRNFDKIKSKLVITETSSGSFKVVYGNYSKMVISRAVSGNCQLNSIMYFDGFLSTLHSDVIFEILSMVNTTPLLFFDVHKVYEKILSCREEVMFIQPYVSSNSSKMVCGIIDKRKINTFLNGKDISKDK